MAKLIVNPTSSARREVALGRMLLSIGRDPSNDVVLPDAMVSRRHAVIECRGSQYFLRDCNSSNGSLVNGDRVSECGLHDGDLVAIGTARLLFREDPLIEGSGKVVHHPSAPRLLCPSCQADYRKGDAFCRQCGAGLAPAGPSALLCVACGTAVLLPASFCSGCGRDLEGAASPPEVTRERPLGGDLGSEEPDTEDAEPGGEPAGDRPAPGAASMIEVPSAHLEPIPETSPVGRAAVEPLPRPAPPPALPERPLPIPARGPRRQPHLADSGENRPAPNAASPAAGLGRRAAAAALDGVLVSLFAAALLTPAVLYWRSRNFATENPSFVAILLTLALLPLVTAAASTYFIYFWGAKGATLGKRLLGLRVETLEGITPIGLGRATLRFLGYLISAGFFGIGFLMGAFEGGALHDRIAATRVVRQEKG
ncbi:MAG TPA: FHA domain-containing protein [Vicinamibacteria bacterium]|nr:FHA domain-containing protein [Vicinamibacteria bacterium]